MLAGVATGPEDADQRSSCRRRGAVGLHDAGSPPPLSPGRHSGRPAVYSNQIGRRSACSDVHAAGRHRRCRRGESGRRTDLDLGRRFPASGRPGDTMLASSRTARVMAPECRLAGDQMAAPAQPLDQRLPSVVHDRLVAMCGTRRPEGPSLLLDQVPVALHDQAVQAVR